MYGSFRDHGGHGGHVGHVCLVGHGDRGEHGGHGGQDRTGQDRIKLIFKLDFPGGWKLRNSCDVSIYFILFFKYRTS